MGMKKEGKDTEFCWILFICFVSAVQKERDRLGRQRGNNYSYGIAPIKQSPNTTGDIEEDDDDLSVMALLKAEQTAQEVL
jgi:hypothetical protein